MYHIKIEMACQCWYNVDVKTELEDYRLNNPRKYEVYLSTINKI